MDKGIITHPNNYILFLQLLLEFIMPRLEIRALLRNFTELLIINIDLFVLYQSFTDLFSELGKLLHFVLANVLIYKYSVIVYLVHERGPYPRVLSLLHWSK